MSAIELKRRGDIAYREALARGAEAREPVLLIHGFPESSLMWEPLMTSLAAGGRRCVAPDLYGLGESTDAGPATFERNLEALARFHRDLGLGRVALVVHDWGGFVGLAWASEHPADAAALVISDTGFFSDGRWHGLAEAIRGPQGEEIVAALDRDGFAALLRSAGADLDAAKIDAYWRPFEDGRGQRATLDFYRSMDFSKLAPYEPGLKALDVPALLLWGARDEFAPLASAKRFARELRQAELVVVEGAGHFVFDEEPDSCMREVGAFLGALEPD